MMHKRNDMLIEQVENEPWTQLEREYEKPLVVRDHPTAHEPLLQAN